MSHGRIAGPDSRPSAALVRHWRHAVVGLAGLTLLPALAGPALANLSLALHLRGDRVGASQLAEASARLAPGAAAAGWALATTAPTEAARLVALEQVLQSDPHHQPAGLMLGQAYAGRGQADRALAAWKSVGAVAYFERLALDAAEQGRPAEAADAAAEALALGSEDGRVHVWAADRALSDGDRETALQRYLGALQHLDRASLLGHYALGRSHELRGQLAEAELAFAGMDDGRFPRVERARGLILAGQVALKDGRPADALVWLERSERLAPLSDWGLIIRGEALGRLGDRAAAAESLRRVSASDPHLKQQAARRLCSLTGENCAEGS
jgi:tetratricopeptide (TPR) repeat protein